MMQSCREVTADKLADLLESCPMTLATAALDLNRSVRYVRSVAEEYPGRFWLTELRYRHVDRVVSLILP